MHDVAVVTTRTATRSRPTPRRSRRRPAGRARPALAAGIWSRRGLRFAIRSAGGACPRSWKTASFFRRPRSTGPMPAGKVDWIDARDIAEVGGGGAAGRGAAVGRRRRRGPACGAAASAAGRDRGSGRGLRRPPRRRGGWGACRTATATGAAAAFFARYACFLSASRMTPAHALDTLVVGDVREILCLLVRVVDELGGREHVLLPLNEDVRLVDHALVGVGRVLEERRPVQGVERTDLDADPAVHAQAVVDREAVELVDGLALPGVCTLWPSM